MQVLDKQQMSGFKFTSRSRRSFHIAAFPAFLAPVAKRMISHFTELEWNFMT
jgi:hypothetical protein